MFLGPRPSVSPISAGNTTKQITILGENMGQRVMPFADRTGARTLGFGASKEKWTSMTPKQRYRLNDGMLRNRIRAGDTFRTLGQDTFRKTALRGTLI
jgi:hypothetical protein